MDVNDNRSARDMTPEEYKQWLASMAAIGAEIGTQDEDDENPLPPRTINDFLDGIESDGTIMVVNMARVNMKQDGDTEEHLNEEDTREMLIDEMIEGLKFHVERHDMWCQIDVTENAPYEHLARVMDILERYGQSVEDQETIRVEMPEKHKSVILVFTLIPQKWGGEYYMRVTLPIFWAMTAKTPGEPATVLRMVFEDSDRIAGVGFFQDGNFNENPEEESE